MHHYQEKFEDDGFIYELRVKSSRSQSTNLYTLSQPNGYACEWTIIEKDHYVKSQVSVTDDACELIVYQTLEAARTGACQFLSIS